MCSGSSSTTTTKPSSSPSSGGKGSCSSSSKPITIKVDEKITQTISNAPAPYTAWNNTYSWTSEYEIVINKNAKQITVTVKLKVSGSITKDQKDKWKTALESKWNGKAVIRNGSGKDVTDYSISIKIEYVSLFGSHFKVTANSSSASEGGRSGLSGTTSMTGWGVTDTVDIGHEFGHMLGNTDEYFTCNGVNYASGSGGFRDSSGGIMNNPANNPKLSNYELIRKKVEGKIGTSSLISP